MRNRIQLQYEQHIVAYREAVRQRALAVWRRKPSDQWPSDSACPDCASHRLRCPLGHDMVRQKRHGTVFVATLGKRVSSTEAKALQQGGGGGGGQPKKGKRPPHGLPTVAESVCDKCGTSFGAGYAGSAFRCNGGAEGCAYHLCPSCATSSALMANPQAGTYSYSAAKAAEDLLEQFDVVLIDGDAMARLMRKNWIKVTSFTVFHHHLDPIPSYEPYPSPPRPPHGPYLIPPPPPSPPPQRPHQHLHTGAPGRARGARHPARIGGGGGERRGVRRWRQRRGSRRRE